MRKSLAALGAIAWLAAPGASAENAPGDALNPAGSDPTRGVDLRGLSHFRPVRSRSPAGFLYPEPRAPDHYRELVAGWLVRSAVEVGGEWTTGDTGETRFGRYADWSDTPLVNFAELGLIHTESGFVADLAGGRLGADDQHYRAYLGWPGLVWLRGSFSGIPRTAAADATPIFTGVGSDRLTLVAPLIAGANTDAELSQALAAAGRDSLSIQRDQSRLSIQARPFDSLTWFARYALDETDGERPFGGSLLYSYVGSDPARVVETIEPRDQKTHRFSTGLQYARDGVAANLEYQGSVFRNDDSKLTWDNPFALAGAGGANVTQGRFALAPDNERHNVSADASIPLPWDGRLTSTVSWSRMLQNDELIAPTVNSGFVGGGLNGFDLGDWNSDAALARNRADARVDTLMLNTRVQLRPIEPLRLGARFRYFDLDNHTRYTAFNPATGEYGYVAEDGAHAVLTPLSRRFVPGTPTDDYRYRATPYAYRTFMAEGTADYRLAPRTTLAGRYRHERIDRDGREREHTREHQARVALTSRKLRWATLRGSYEFRDRGGGSYEPFPNDEDFVSSLAGFAPLFSPLAPHTLAQLRKVDLANRRRHVSKLSANFLPREDLDFSVSAQLLDDDYGSGYGLRRDRRFNVDVDLGFQPSEKLSLHAFGHFQSGDSRLTGISSAPAASSDPNAFGPVFPIGNRWAIDTDATTFGAGTGFRLQPHRNVAIDINYTWIQSHERNDFDTNGTGPLTPGLTQAADLPTLRRQDHVVEASLRLSVHEQVALRLLYRFEHSTLADYSQRDLDSPSLVADSGALLLGHIDRDFAAHLFGAMVQLRY